MVGDRWNRYVLADSSSVSSKYTLITSDLTCIQWREIKILTSPETLLKGRVIIEKNRAWQVSKKVFHEFNGMFYRYNCNIENGIWHKFWKYHLLCPFDRISNIMTIFFWPALLKLVCTNILDYIFILQDQFLQTN